MKLPNVNGNNMNFLESFSVIF